MNRKPSRSDCRICYVKKDSSTLTSHFTFTHGIQTPGSGNGQAGYGVYIPWLKRVRVYIWLLQHKIPSHQMSRTPQSPVTCRNVVVVMNLVLFYQVPPGPKVEIVMWVCIKLISAKKFLRSVFIFLMDACVWNKNATKFVRLCMKCKVECENKHFNNTGIKCIWTPSIYE